MVKLMYLIIYFIGDINVAEIIYCDVQKSSIGQTQIIIIDRAKKSSSRCKFRQSHARTISDRDEIILVVIVIVVGINNFNTHRLIQLAKTYTFISELSDKTIRT